MPMSIPDAPRQPKGWAVECRIAGEDPANGFLPATGRIEYLRVPAGPGVRWDAGVETGDEVTLYYDSMLAKLIVWAPDRTAALDRMDRALGELIVAGLPTNQGFHRRLIRDPAFRAGEVDIQFLDRRQDLLTPPEDGAMERVVAVAAALAEDEARRNRKPAIAPETSVGRWTEAGRRAGLRDGGER
jgi:acetyl/propionyl-CoA carboxylase alpha subunit